MSTTHSLEDLKKFHQEAIQFFGAELMLLSEAIPKIEDDRIGKCAVLLNSAGQTGLALIQLASQTDIFTSQSMMLARAFMEKATNFCYACVCDEKEYRAFILHPVYKNYHNVGALKMEDNVHEDLYNEILAARKLKQENLKKLPLVQEALAMFSETKPYLSWTKKTLNQRIDTIEEWGKLLDVFFTLNKLRYYSDASEVLHGSLYGCTYQFALFDSDFDRTEEELDKRIHKETTCMLLHLGILVHECLTLIQYENKIEEVYNHSYTNRKHALNLLFHVLGRNLTKK